MATSAIGSQCVVTLYALPEKGKPLPADLTEPLIVGDVHHEDGETEDGAAYQYVVTLTRREPTGTSAL